MESSRNEVLPNNSLIIVSGLLHRIPSFRALSGSNRSNVGQLINPLSNDITRSRLDPFIVSLGNSYDPGSMYVRCLKDIAREDIGIYTYHTPDEEGNIINVNFGIYSVSASSIVTSYLLLY